MSQFRVAIVNKILQPSGSLRWSYGWSRGLAAHGFQITTVFIRSSRSSEKLADRFGDARVEVYVRGLLARVSEVVWYPLIYWLLRDVFTKESSPDPLSWILSPLIGRWKQNYDFALAHDEYTATSTFIAHRLFRLPYVLFFQEAVPQDEPRIQSLVLNRWRRVVARHAILLVANSKKIAESYERILGQKVWVIPHGSEPLESITTAKQNAVLADTRWTEWRNPMFLLDIAEKVPETEFWVTSSFSSSDLSRRFNDEIHRRKLEGRVRVFDLLSEKRLEHLYETALVYVRWAARAPGLPPESGSSFGVYQACAAGCPMIVDSALDIDPVLRECDGVHIVPYDADQFAYEIRRLYNDREQVAQEAVATWELSKKISWETRAATLLGLLHIPGRSEADLPTSDHTVSKSSTTERPSQL